MQSENFRIIEREGFLSRNRKPLLLIMDQTIYRKLVKILQKAQKQDLSQNETDQLDEFFMLWKHEPVNHDELIRKVKETALDISVKDAAEGFLYSISTGDYRYRTALSSLIWANALPAHVFEMKKRYDKKAECMFCGAIIDPETNRTEFSPTEYHLTRMMPQKTYIDICCAGYVLCDLEFFKTLPQVTHFAEDIRILNRIFGLAKEISPSNKVNALLKQIAEEKTIPLTQADVFSVLGVLSSCGVFDTPDHKSYRSGFVPCAARGMEYGSDIYYPLNFWRGKHGICYEAVKEVFGEEISELVNEKTAIYGRARGTDRKKTSSKAEQYFKEGEYIVALNDRYRYYYGISSIRPEWQCQTMYSVTHQMYKRTEFYFEDNVVRKMIYEELRGRKDDKMTRYYLEADMCVETEDREWVIPKTTRGRRQRLTPSLLKTPTYMLGQLQVYYNEEGELGVTSFNSSNDQLLPIPENKERSRLSFEEFTESYIAQCPPDYDKVLKNFQNKKRVTVRFREGDIFRVQISPQLYTYGLILGKVRQLEKWTEIPADHPIRHTMTQPIIYRQYGIITPNANMTANELTKYPLLNMEIAQDNEILWETYPIVYRKELTESDVDLGFKISPKLKTVVWGLTMHRFGDEFAQIFDMQDEMMMQDDRLMHDFVANESFMQYGVSLEVNVKNNDFQAGIIEPESSKTDEWKKMLQRYLELDPIAPQDDFAVRYGGITRGQYIKLAKERFNK